MRDLYYRIVGFISKSLRRVPKDCFSSCKWNSSCDDCSETYRELYEAEDG